MSNNLPFTIIPGAHLTNHLLNRILYALMNNGAFGMIPGHFPDNVLLKGIVYQLTNGGGGGSAPSGVIVPFATSIAAAKAKPSASVGVGNFVQILGAVNPGQLSTYQLQNGTPTQASPAQFQPNDNPNLVYTLVS